MIRRLLGRFENWGLNREVFMLGLARAMDSFGASLMIIMLPLFIEHYDITFLALPTTLIIGLVLSIYGFTNTSAQPAVGVLIDRTDHHKLYIATGLFLYAAATGLFVFTRSFYSIAGLRIIQGIGVALTIPPSVALMTEFSHAHNRATAMSFYNVMRLFGFSTGPVVGGYLLTWFSFTPVILISALTGAIGALLVYLLVPAVSTKKPVNQDSFFSNFTMFLDPSMGDFLKLAVANVTMALSISLVTPLEYEFNLRLNQTPGDFGVAFSALIVTVIVVQIPIGRVSDKFGRKPLIVLGLLILAPSTVWMGYLSTTTQFILARMIQGVGVACVAAPTFALGGDKSTDERRGREMSLLTMAFGLGIALGPLIAGYLVGQYYFQVPFLLGGILLTLSAVMVWMTVSPRVVADLPENA